jgi:acetolactate synthase-1/2/3 large subunit
MVDIGIIGDVANVLEEMIAIWQRRSVTPDRNALNEWWQRINRWRQRNCLGYATDSKLIKPQHAIKRLYELTKDREDVFITTEVGQHQMWAAQHYGFDKPNRWMTSGGLGTMGYGLPSAMGVQLAHPDALVVDIAGEASIMMNIQEMSTIAQYNLPVKVFILNNEYMGMVRQWQELLHGSRYSQSYMASLPDFVKLADAFGGVGLRAEKPEQLDDVIREMIETPRCVIADIMVDKAENCFPMIPSGAAHNEMLMGPADKAEQPISEDGMVLV